MCGGRKLSDTTESSNVWVVEEYEDGVDEHSTCIDDESLDLSIAARPPREALLERLLSSPRVSSFALIGARI
jgi:hypothetical protein